MMGEILVLAEHRSGELRDITFEMLTLANRLGKENDLIVTALFLGHEASDLAGQLTGACDTVLVMDDPELANYNADPYLVALDAVIKARMPSLTIIGHTSMGMDLVPALAARTSLPLVTDCVEVNLAEGRLEVLRQIYGGKINAQLTMKPSDRYLISLRTGSFDTQTDQGKSGTVETLSAPSWEKSRGRKFLTYLEAELGDVDIGAADILVSIGRGIGKPENIPLAQEFADAIGATLACSRPVADEQWLPKSRQVGTSGKTVRPKIYIALGISGAYQHQAGMKNADTIIAVNTDQKAPIFNIAHYGIVADILEVMPQLTDKFAKE
ncbi:MAG: electron transfer flavoprotein subunit alpha/FixB family protein [Deltaproteobacteria bacterium]|nr:electron transfer flavoprotein subunit alpha/FixB family protein [Deltaproteobacteria bacterium]MBW2309647.1 electron transfer flavoprotein subunit alpha/FixB family protein [Deltaproteobacteria bacterium]